MDDTLNTRTEADALSEIIGKLNTPVPLTLKRGTSDECTVIAVPGKDGIKLESVRDELDKYLTKPERRQGTARMLTLEAFILHVLRFSDEGSEIFCDTSNIKAPKLLAILDYHDRGATGSPRFGRHRTLYDFPMSDEWTAWNQVNKQWLSQEQFASFLEDRIMDVLNPDQIQARGKKILEKIGTGAAGSSRMMALSKGLSVTVNHLVTNEVNLATGEGQVVFTENHQDAQGKPLDVPNAFAICIPVFDCDAPYDIVVRLRYRVRDKKVAWQCTIFEPNVVLKDAISIACDKVSSQTKLELLNGTPEI
jgi:uncharacterized protein YfdQ (DUF2303 family)